jgi:hypothetical protein
MGEGKGIPRYGSDTGRCSGSLFQHIVIISRSNGGQFSGTLGVNPLVLIAIAASTMFKSLCGSLCATISYTPYTKEKHFKNDIITVTTDARWE